VRLLLVFAFLCPLFSQAGNFSLSAGLSVTSLSYTESSISQKELAVVPKIGFLNYLGSQTSIAIAGSGYYTAFVSSATYDPKIQFYGLNGRIGYVSRKKGQWLWDYYIGAYFVSSIVSGSAYGFTKMSGPQIYPVLRKSGSDGHTSFSCYLKYSPVFNGSALLGLGNYEIATGATLALMSTKSATQSLTVDASRMSLTLSGIKMITTSYSAGLTYGF
jgi:hypothetical protein